MLTSPIVSWVLAAVAGVLAIVFLAGKGKGVLELFGTTKDKMSGKKRTPEQERRYQRAIGLFLVVLAVCEVIMALFAQQTAWVALLLVGIDVVALVCLGLYISKNF